MAQLECWYYFREGKTYGPVTMQTLRGLTSILQVEPKDWVWRKDMPDWVRAGSLPELFPPPRASVKAPPGEHAVSV